MKIRDARDRGKGFLFCVFIIFAIFLFSPRCFAQSFSSNELINNAKQYDAKVVVYQGELIGDIMLRGEFAWLNISDGNTAIGIWVEKQLLKEISVAGSYKSKGDWVEVVGIFQRVCKEHGGDLDIHAQSLRKIYSGRQLNERLNTAKRDLALTLLVILVIIWILKQLRSK